MNKCVCGAASPYAACCEPYHKGAKVPTAEALVRARYSAFALQNYDFIVQTTHPMDRDEFDSSSIAQNMSNIIWHSLNITNCGQEIGSDGKQIFDTVTFTAAYEQAGKLYSLSEVSYFQRLDDTLYYFESISHRPESYKRTLPKVGRNDPCPCGSGKKHKKCCA